MTVAQRRKRDREYNRKHRAWIRERQRIWRAMHPNHKKDYLKRWQHRNRKSIQRKRRLYYLRNRGRILGPEVKQRNKAARDARKAEVILHYSHGENKCSCCGEKTYEFLSLDHINGGGTAHRKALGGGQFFLWLHRNGFPKGYQVLCFNCNLAKGFYGQCPHERRRR
jgi:hypothetical protein